MQIQIGLINPTKFFSNLLEIYIGLIYPKHKNRPTDCPTGLNGWDGRTRTSEMPGPKPGALPLGDIPLGMF